MNYTDMEELFDFISWLYDGHDAIKMRHFKYIDAAIIQTSHARHPYLQVGPGQYQSYEIEL